MIGVTSIGRSRSRSMSMSVLTATLTRFLLLACLSMRCRRDGISRSSSTHSLINRDDAEDYHYHVAVDAFVVVGFNSIAGRRTARRQRSSTTGKNNDDDNKTGTSRGTTSSSLKANRPRRFAENADGPLYVNDKCINCAACSMFSPSIFARESDHHIVSKQPTSEQEIEESRAALAACPVAAIRVEQHNDSDGDGDGEDSLVDDDARAQFAINPKFNGRSLPFPRPISPNLSDVYFVGHHNSKSFGAAPYLVSTSSSSSSPSTSTTIPTWIMVDTPRFSESAVRAVEAVTGPNGPSYLVLTHVDDTADHNRWKERYPNLKRVFHAGDLGVHNWIGDKTLEDVEILLESRSSDCRLQYFDLNGRPIIDNDRDDDDDRDHDVVLVHTPGHSPGSIALLKRSTVTTTSSNCDGTVITTTNNSPGVLFSGDTYSYTTREGGHMSGFPLYGNDPLLQSKILPLLLDLDWQIVAPGHGHVRDYTMMQQKQNQNQLQKLQDVGNVNTREAEMVDAIEELSRYF